MMDATETPWTSAHLYYSRPDVRCADEVLMRIVLKLVELDPSLSIDRHYFFVRYFDHGPHIRLRVRNDLPNYQWLDLLQKRVDEWNEERVFAQRVEVQPARYERELERYGGSRAIHAAEEFFVGSSSSVISFLKGKANGVSKGERLGHALLSMFVLGRAFLGEADRIEGFFRGYAEAYEALVSRRSALQLTGGHPLTEHIDSRSYSLFEYIRQTGSDIDAGNSLGPALDRLYDGACGAKVSLMSLVSVGGVFTRTGPAGNWIACAHYLLPSYVHMHSNRLGVSIAEEIALAKLLADGLRRVREGL